MRPVPMPLVLAALAVVYFVAGKLGLSFATVHSSASAVWPPTGIALGAFLIWGNRVWPAIFIGAFAVNETTAGNVFTSFGIAAGNTLEGMVGALLVTHFANGTKCFERARDVFKFAALGAIMAPVVSATIGVTTLCMFGFAKWEAFYSIWITWWLGDATGALVVTPVILLWYATPWPPIPIEHRGEAIPTLILVLAVTVACFTAPVLHRYPLAFLCLPPLAWVAFRFSPREVATGLFIVTTIAVVATEKGMGSFVMATRNESLLVLQSFTAMAAITLLPMAALVREHKLAVKVADDATRARDVFLAMLSHELRNPLQAIVGALHVLEQSKDPGQVQHAAAIARRQTDHLSRLLNDLLDVARAVTGKVRLDMRTMSLDEAARRCVDLVRASDRRLEQRTLTIDVAPVLINADVARIEQIVTNLLSNAIKFTNPDGTIHVTVQTTDGKAQLRVRDNGIGMPMDLLPRVFDLFTQGERKLDRREGGLGIGLTLVKSLAELQGGSVRALSDGSGHGSELIVEFPLASELVTQAAEQPAQPKRPRIRRVVIIEDNVDARETLRAVLTADGHEVFEAGDGEKGIEIAQRLKPDIVLIDIGLPGIDGYDVVRALREKQTSIGVRWRLIALTGYGQPEDVRLAQEAGFDAHLVKPVFPEALLLVMRA